MSGESHVNNDTKPTILLVDDEERALKYFQRAYRDDFDVLTASDIYTAREILDENSDKISIVVTDQRMPRGSGTEFLADICKAYPAIIRILTTAYSDLESAIAAVNEGSIYQYVVKPWKLPELRIILNRAHEFFTVQRERDQLLGQKMSVLQRMIISDRIRVLTLFARDYGEMKNAFLSSFGFYLKAVPPALRDRWRTNPYMQRSGMTPALSQFTHSEDDIVFGAVEALRAHVKGLVATDDSGYDINGSLTAFREKLKAEFGEKLQDNTSSAEFPKIAGIGAAEALVEPLTKVFYGLLDKVEVESEEKATLEHATDGECVTFSLTIPSIGEQPNWFAILTDNVNLDFSISLLKLFFTAYAHQGSITIEFQEGAIRALSVRLPVERKEDEQDTVLRHPVKSIENIFMRWDLMR